jgi:glyoxylase-like metal-dependent hydrolase (beta-lactamase superfamily II)
MSDATYHQEIGPYGVTTVVNGQYRQNGYVVLHHASNSALIVDPGSREDDIAAIVDKAGAVSSAILLTHGHFDHLGAAHALGERWGIASKAHKREVKLIRQAPLYALRFVRKAIRAPRIDPFESIESLEWPGGTIGVIETPGHTEGSVCYTLPGMVFTGDVLLREHIGPTFYPGSDRDELMRSVESFLARDLLGDAAIFAGHGRPWTVQEARDWWTKLDGPPPAYAIGHIG